MSKEENQPLKFIVTLPEPKKSVSINGHTEYYFASDVFRAIRESGGEVKFKRVEGE